MYNLWEASHSSEQTEVAPQETLSDTLDAYRVVLFNDDVHTFDEVIFQIIKAIQCTRSKAEKHTWEVHTKGSSIVYAGTLPTCLKVSSILEEIDLKTEIQTG
ncbi:ATP-dependent Clp protease adaptor ClpS [Prosthecochloris sp.]|uniref:ATP-dependent Clp protease adaptor ClpS n=1 Tax=Prosthecochloris sp. TaxID=290513 RepID=UPI0025DCE9C0|nr:ATP-dependent Clp protease adaptor ClpS [Prosthecochloris sp.]